MKKKLAFLLGTMLFALNALAQVTVTGVVLSADEND